MMFVPLVARWVIMGVADLCRLAGSPPFTAADLDLARDFSAARRWRWTMPGLYTRERAAALALQRGLLPARSPRSPASTWPGATCPPRPPPRSAATGSTSSLSRNRCALTVGDVTGHDISAASLMGQLRTVTRTLTTLDLPHSEILTRLDQPPTSPTPKPATCLYAVHDPATPTADWEIASAGHPRPPSPAPATPPPSPTCPPTCPWAPAWPTSATRPPACTCPATAPWSCTPTSSSKTPPPTLTPAWRSWPAPWPPPASCPSARPATSCWPPWPPPRRRHRHHHGPNLTPGPARAKENLRQSTYPASTSSAMAGSSWASPSAGTEMNFETVVPELKDRPRAEFCARASRRSTTATSGCWCRLAGGAAFHGYVAHAETTAR
jgi:hypothetical protein